jgi:hypothetical protein
MTDESPPILPGFTEFLRSTDLDGCRLKLNASLHYLSVELDRVVTIPRGFECDSYSAPRDLLGSWIVRGIDRRPAVLHDWLYRDGRNVSRAQADLALLEAMKSVGIETWRANSIYAAVRAFGWRYYQKKGPSA